MKRILLVCQRLTNSIDVSYGLDNIRNYAMQQHDLNNQVDIEILSPGLDVTIQDLTMQIINKSPDMVGLSTFIWSVFDNMILAEKIKKQLPEVIIIFGGPQVSDTHWDILKYTPFVDGVIRGEGEVTFCELLRFWLNSGSICNQEIAGFSYRNVAGTIIHNCNRPHIENMDIIPFRYQNTSADKDKIYGLETVRGCYNRCGYCSMGGMAFRKHSVEYILDEISNMAEAGIRTISIWDSSFTFDRRRMELISRRLSDYGLRYTCCAKAEELDEDMMDILLETGALKVELGLQTINPYALKLMNRNYDLDLYKKNAHLLINKCKGKDMEVSIDIICGLPGDNLITFCQSMDFAYSLKPHCISSFPLCLLPGTDFFINHEKYGFKFVLYTQQMENVKNRYNMHKFGMVLENVTFSKEELEKGRVICLFNGFLMHTKYVNSIYEILDKYNITFTQFYNGIDKYLPIGFYDCLEASNNNDARHFIWNSFCDALTKYNTAL